MHRSIELGSFKYFSRLPDFTNLEAVDRGAFSYLWKTWSRGTIEKSCSLAIADCVYIHNGVAVCLDNYCPLGASQEKRFIEKAVKKSKALQIANLKESGQDSFLPHDKLVDVDFLYVTSPGGRMNYGHFLTDTMPILCSLGKSNHVTFHDSSLDNCTFLLESPPKNRPDLQNAFLSLLKVFAIPSNKVQWISTGATLSRTIGVYDGLKQHPALHNPYPLRFARNTLQTLLPKSKAKPVFLSRGSTLRRNLLNEKQFVEALQSVLPELVYIDCTKETCETQLHACRNASMIVGVMGANMSNFLAAASGTPCFFIAPIDLPGLYFWDICNILGFPYIEYRVGTSLGSSTEAMELPEREIYTIVSLIHSLTEYYLL